MNSLITEVIRISDVNDVKLTVILYYFRRSVAQWLEHCDTTLEVRGSPLELNKIHSIFHRFGVDKMSTKHIWRTKPHGLFDMLTTETYATYEYTALRTKGLTTSGLKAEFSTTGPDPFWIVTPRSLTTV